MKRVLLICALLLAGWAAAAPAQMTQSDSAAVLLGVANKLRAEGRASLANSLIDLILERYRGTPAAAEAEQLRAQFRVTPEERSGRTELLVWSTTYGLALGALTPVALGTDGPETVGVGLIVGGPAGFLLGRQYLKSRPVSEGQARALSFGTSWGAWQGFGWTEALELGQDSFCDQFGCYDVGSDGETQLRGTLLGSLVGLGTGLVLAGKPIRAGTATTVSFGALWGIWYGVATNVLAGRGDEVDGLQPALIGGNIGLLATALLDPKWQLSVARARLISISGVAGLLAGFGVTLITQPEEDAWILVPMATSAAGLAMGVHWTRNYDERAQPRDDDNEDALLSWRNGALQPGVPMLQLRAVETRRAGRPAWERAVYLPVFKAAF